jgi:hypothetical protein
MGMFECDCFVGCDIMQSDKCQYLIWYDMICDIIYDIMWCDDIIYYIIYDVMWYDMVYGMI